MVVERPHPVPPAYTCGATWPLAPLSWNSCRVVPPRAHGQKQHVPLLYFQGVHDEGHQSSHQLHTSAQWGKTRWKSTTPEQNLTPRHFGHPTMCQTARAGGKEAGGRGREGARSSKGGFI